MTTLALILLLPLLALGFTGLTMLFAESLRGEVSRPLAAWAREGLGYLIGAIALIGIVAELVSGAIWRTSTVQGFLGSYGMNLALLGLAFVLAGPAHRAEG